MFFASNTLYVQASEKRMGGGGREGGKQGEIIMKRGVVVEGVFYSNLP